MKKLNASQKSTLAMAVCLGGMWFASWRAVTKAKAEVPSEEKPPAKERLKNAAKDYGPYILIGVVCTWGIAKVHSSDRAAINELTEAVGIGSAAFAAYRDKVVEHIGKTKEAKIHEEYAEEEYKRRGYDKIDFELIPGEGPYIAFDGEFGGMVRTTYEDIRRAITSASNQATRSGYCTINDFHWELGMKGQKAPRMLDEFGFTEEQVLDDGGIVDVSVRAFKLPNNEPGYILEYTAHKV